MQETKFGKPQGMEKQKLDEGEGSKNAIFKKKEKSAKKDWPVRLGPVRASKQPKRA